mgnify:CR=1 FL=1
MLQIGKDRMVMFVPRVNVTEILNCGVTFGGDSIRFLLLELWEAQDIWMRDFTTVNPADPKAFMFVLFIYIYIYI